MYIYIYIDHNLHIPYTKLSNSESSSTNPDISV